MASVANTTERARQRLAQIENTYTKPYPVAIQKEWNTIRLQLRTIDDKMTKKELARSANQRNLNQPLHKR